MLGNKRLKYGRSKGQYNKISRGIKFTVYLVIYGVTRGSPLAELVRVNSLLANTYSNTFSGMDSIASQDFKKYEI